MALTEVKQEGLDDEAVNESKLQISNAGTNGQYLQKQSGNTGGLTWADVPAGVGGATGADFNDDVQVRLGTGNDLTLKHNGTHSFIQNATGSLLVEGDSVVLRSSGQENYLVGTANGSVDIYHDDSKKLATTSNGVNINGDTTADTWDQNVLIVGTETLALGRAEANNAGPHLHFYKSRNGTWGSNTVVQDDDQLGNIIWYADDGADYKSPAASIQGAVDGTPGSNDMPGRIVFNTTPDGSETLTERMRIDSSGLVGIGLTNPDGYSSGANNLVVNDASGAGGITIVTPSSDMGSLFFSDGTGANSQGRIRYDHSQDQLTFGTNGTGSRVIVESDGDLKVADGNLVIGTAGHGIDFSAQTPTSATGASNTAEVLDHYEYGTWTPVVKIGSTVNSGTVSGAVYTRIGDLVCAQCTVTSISDTGSGNITVEGQPFTRTQGDPTGILRWAGVTSNGRIWPYVNSNSVQFQDGNSSGYVGSITHNNLSGTWNIYSLQMIYHCS